jgi:methionine synthase II (cobalamin-independent)
MSRAVATIVREQRNAGIDIVSDGEIGKVSWISYLFERISGLEVRELPPGSVFMPPSRDRQAFPEYYAEEDQQSAHQARRVQILGAKGMQARRGIRPVRSRAMGVHWPNQV